MKTATLEVVSERETKSKELSALKEKVEKEIEKKNAELENKLYIIEGGVSTANDLINFLEHEADWKFTESMGIIEAVKEITKARENVSKAKVNALLFSPLTIEATYYFLTKYEGKGLDQAKYYYEKLLKPVSEALSRSKADRTQLDQMQRDLATIENAIENGANVEDSLVKEILSEIENGTYGTK